MPANRFFCNSQLQVGTSITITGSEHHHMRVMRTQLDEEVEIINGTGAIASAKVLTLQKDSSQLVLTKLFQSPPINKHIVLIVPIMRPNKLEWIVEKGTELGADAFHFYVADFCEKMQLSENQSERLHNLCLSALKQSGRLYIPHIEVLPSLERAMVEEAIYYFGDTRDCSHSIIDVPCGERTGLITGPERGFSTAELELLDKSAKGVRLSANILRAETAPIVGLSILGLKLT